MHPGERLHPAVSRSESFVNDTVPDTLLQRMRWIVCLVFLGLFVYYVVATVHWPIVWDGSVMHYIRFLMSRGFQPYSDITDMNLPGAYLTEGWAMAVFGWSDLSWRVYEFFLIALLTVSGMVIGGPRHWLAGVYTGMFFMMLHGSEGSMMAVERDEVMTILLVAAMACFFIAIRRRQPWVLLPYGLLAGLAASIKPGAVLLDVALMLLAFVTLRRQAQPAARYVLWALGGNLLVLGLVAGFIAQHHAFTGLLFLARHVLPSYASEKNAGRLYLLRHLTPVPLLPMLGAALLSVLIRWRRPTWEQTALLLGAFVGAFSYWAQAKGYLYHRYLYTTFLVLWAGWELTGPTDRAKPVQRTLQVAGAALLLLIAIPFYVHRLYEFPRTVPPPEALAFALDRDLQTLGGTDALQGEVQCLDLVNGCLNALYRLRLVQNNGMTGDLLLFSPTPGAGPDYYHAWFTKRELQHPASVVVLGNEWYHRIAVNFDKINTWPQYAQYLRSDYVPIVERHFGKGNEPAYRIYLRKGSPVLERYEAAPAKL